MSHRDRCRGEPMKRRTMLKAAGASLVGAGVCGSQVSVARPFAIDFESDNDPAFQKVVSKLIESPREKIFSVCTDLLLSTFQRYGVGRDSECRRPGDHARLRRRPSCSSRDPCVTAAVPNASAEIAARADLPCSQRVEVSSIKTNQSSIDWQSRITKQEIRPGSARRF